MNQYHICKCHWWWKCLLEGLARYIHVHIAYISCLVGVWRKEYIDLSIRQRASILLLEIFTFPLFVSHMIWYQLIHEVRLTRICLCSVAQSHLKDAKSFFDAFTYLCRIFNTRLKLRLLKRFLIDWSHQRYSKVFAQALKYIQISILVSPQHQKVDEESPGNHLRQLNFIAVYDKLLQINIIYDLTIKLRAKLP